MRKTVNILVIDDDQLFSTSLSDFLGSRGYHVSTAASGRQGVRIFKELQPSIVLLDQKLPDIPGLEVCKQVLEVNPHTKIVFITAYATIQYAVDAMQAGAFNYLSKPFELDELLIVIDLAVKNLKLEGRLRVSNYEKQQERRKDQLVGSSEVMRRIREQIHIAAESEATVLITGETGVGKNAVARAVHELQKHRESLLTINCSAIPENLIEAEYFGHEKGVFTGADSRREGIFELADGGTLVLDEIGEVPTHLQSKLLSVLEDKCIRRIGSGRTIPVDVRIIATTNQNLENAIRDGRFRQDLFYRLAVFNLHIPPLREHPEDIPELAAHFLSEFGRRELEIPEEQIERMVQYSWPGNVRELRNVIERASFLYRGDEIKPGDLLIQDTFGSDRVLPATLAGDGGRIPTLEEVEQRHILQVYKACEGNKSRTARALGISLSTLKRKLKTMNVNHVEKPDLTL
jgi:DNA-binding NtrC family response regulator